MLRERLSPPVDLFPPNPWALEAVGLDPKIAVELVGQQETMFALSNGYLGLRGTWDEGVPSYEPGVFLNGFYEHRPISYGEHAYGFPRRGQSILNCPDGTIVKLFIDGEPFVVTKAEVVSFHRTLDLRQGIVRRDVTWITPAGHRMRLRTTRFVSFTHRHLAGIMYELSAQDAEVDVVISSELRHQQPLPMDSFDPRLAVGLVGRVLHPKGILREGMRVVLSYATDSSRLVLGCGMDHVLEAVLPFTADTTCEEDLTAVTFRGQLRPGQPLRLSKYLGYHYAPSDDADPIHRHARGDDAAQIRSQVKWSLDHAVQAGIPALLERQRNDLSRFWAHADIEIESADPRMQQVVRWNLFQLLQASGRSEGHGIAARGLTGQTYEGHYFWDMEIYILPFLIYQEPRIARNLLKFRYDGLGKARARARELGHRGATFPWRTIDGEEASAYYAAGTAQYHINADIAYTLRKYVEVSGDTGFLCEYGAEILIETARFWRDLGFFSDRKDGKFCINGVTGPDEYTAVVNNNYFTNLMAQENLRYAAATVRWLKREDPEAFRELTSRTGLEDGEVASWHRAADLMYLPYDERLGVRPQDDSFLDKEVWDFAATPETNYPLLLHYHPLNLYRAQVIKQADTLLAMFLLGEQVSPEEKKRNFDYYDPLTTHDSSLSVCIQSIVANEIGYREKALRYFRFAAVMDFSDVGGNMKHGAHIASIGGTWLALVFGFAGMRDHGGRISFRPCLPAEWKALRFCLAIRKARLHVEMLRDETRYRLDEGEGLTIHHAGEEIFLTPGAGAVSRGNPQPPAKEPVPDFKPSEDPARPNAGDAAKGAGIIPRAP
jgi:alpha,alpha-trehalose phosphorylase